MSHTLLSRQSRLVVTGSALAAVTSMSLLTATLTTADAAVHEKASHSARQAAAKVAASTLRVKIGGSSVPVTSVNTGRKPGKIVIYKSRLAAPKAKKGVDVAVSGGRVQAVLVHNRAHRKGLTVPRGGFVVSGTGRSAAWLTHVSRRGIPAVTMYAKPAAAAAHTVYSNGGGTTSSAPMGLPSRVQAVYHMMWSNSGSPRLSSLPSNINVVNLAFLQGSAQLVGWGSQSEDSFIADAKAMRARGVRIVASVGGAGGAVNTADRAAFVQGVMELNAKLPLDGLDWDIENSSMSSADIVWISERLKELRGNRFAITLAPNGSNIDQYRAIAVQLQRGNALDMIGQQFYDAVVSKEAAKGRIDQLISSGIPQSKIGVGMMVGSTSNYWTVDECMAVVRFIKSSYPSLRGGYLWEAGRPGTADWASSLSPLLKS